MDEEKYRGKARGKTRPFLWILVCNYRGERRRGGLQGRKDQGKKDDKRKSGLFLSEHPGLSGAALFLRRKEKS